MPTRDDAYDRMRLVASQWTVTELDHLVHALKRDRTMGPKMLACYLEKKSPYQVKELLSAILSCPEKLLTGHVRAVRAESTIDILSQTTRHISGEPNSSVMGTSEALMQYADELDRRSRCSTTSCSPNLRNHSSREMRFPQLYRFLACIMHDRPPPSLSPVESTAVLDLLACVVHVMEQVQCQSEKSGPSNTVSSDATRSASSETPQTSCNEVLNKVIDKTGVYLAACAATRWSPSMRNEVSSFISKKHPVAPFFILDDVEPPKSNQSSKALVRSVVDRLVQSWTFPKLPDQCYKEDCSGLNDLSERDYHLLVKRITAFSLNPFALTREEMTPLQNLLDTIYTSDLVGSVSFEHLLQTANRTAQNGPLVLVDTPESHSSSLVANQHQPMKRTSVPLCVSSSAKRAKISQSQKSSHAPQNSAPPRRIFSQHERPFIRLPDAEDQWQTDRQIKKFINVQFKTPDNLNSKNKTLKRQ